MSPRLTLCTLEDRTAPAAGDLDVNFGTAGVVVSDLPGAEYDTLQAVAIDAAGRVLAAGTSRVGSEFGFTLVRYTADGSLDPSFGTAGTGVVFTKTSPVALSSAFANDVLIDPAGRILVAGHASQVGTYPAFAVARYTPDGLLDPTFGGTGFVSAPTTVDQMTGYGMALDAAGRVVVAGAIRIAGGDEELALVRFNADGSFDTDFGDGGRVVTRLSPNNDYARGVAVDSEGRIAVAGSDGTTAPFGRLCVMRYLADGSPDPDFGDDGVVTGLDYGGANGLTLDAADRLLITGTAPGFQLPVVLRFLPDGSLDPAFGDCGEVVVSAGPGSVGALGRIRLDAADRIVVAGGLQPAPGVGLQFAVVRLTPDGEPDATFGGDGLVLTDVPHDYDLAFSVAFDSAGHIVAAGTSQDATDPNPANQFRFVLARYLGEDGPNEPANRPPTLFVPVSAVAVPGSPTTFTATATDPDVPAQTLTFSLVDPPSGASIDPVSGVVTWTPDPDTPDGILPIQVRVTDDGDPALSYTRAVPVSVTRAALRDYNPFTGYSLLTIAGTNGADDIRIFQSDQYALSVDVNGRTYGPFSTFDFREFVARGFAGDDRIEVGESLNFNGRQFGGAGDDTLLGGAGGDYLDGEAGEDQLSGRDSYDVLIGGAGNDALAGGAGFDEYRFAADWGRDAVTEAAGADIDTLDFSATTGVTTTVGERVRVRAGASTVTTNGRTVENLVGSPGADVLHFPAGDNTWRVGGVVNDWFFYRGVESLQGGVGPDRFVMGSAPNVSVAVDGGGGRDTVDYTYSRDDIAIDLAAGTAPGLSRYDRVEKFVGSASEFDALTGPAATAFWDLNGYNAGTVGGTRFDGFENLTGGAFADTFRFAAEAGFRGVIDGGGGVNALDYSRRPDRIIVNLSIGTAFWTGGVRNVRDAIGGDGPDILIGDAGANRLSGNGGRDVLIGGAGADRLSGGADEDILIGGTTAHDGSPVAQADVLTEWWRPRPYPQVPYGRRVEHLLGERPNGLNGSTYLNATTVFDDGAGDTMLGERGRDWFLTGAGDETDRGDDERRTGCRSPGGPGIPLAVRPPGGHNDAAPEARACPRSSWPSSSSPARPTWPATPCRPGPSPASAPAASCPGRISNKSSSPQTARPCSAAGRITSSPSGTPRPASRPASSATPTS